MKSSSLKLFLYFLTGFILLFLVVLISIPFLFKKDIKQYVVKEIDKTLKGSVTFTDFSVSCFNHFPSASVSLENFCLTDTSRTDSIATIKELRIVIDLIDLVKNEKIDVKMLLLKQPVIALKVTQNGIANYDIIKTNTEQGKDSLGLSFEELIIEEGKLIYVDSISDIHVQVKSFNLEGEAELKESIFGLHCVSDFSKLSIASGGMQVLNNKDLLTDFNLDLDFKNNQIYFRKNSTKVNNLEFVVDGSVSWQDSVFVYDLNFKTERDELKDLISIVPGIYTDDLKDLVSQGSMSVSGWIKGVKNESIFPAFHIDCKIKNGQLSHASLPHNIRNIQFDLTVKNRGGLLENTSVNFNKVHFDMDRNSFRGYLKIKDLKHYNTTAEIKSEIDLERMTKLFPVEGFDVAGKFISDIKIKGDFDRANGKLPQMDAKVKLVDGFIKSKEYQASMDSIRLDATITNASGKWEETLIQLDTFTYKMDEEPFIVKGMISNLKNFDLFIKGKFNLEKIASIFNPEGMTVQGKIDVDLEAQGNVDDFNKLILNGKLGLSNVLFSTANFPQGVFLENGTLTMDKDKVFLDGVNGKFAGSNFNVHGHLFDYIAYFYNDNVKLRGDMLFECDTLDVHKWEQAYKGTSLRSDTIDVSVFRIPKGIDFIFDSDIHHLEYGDIVVNKLIGEITLHEGMMTLKETGFNTIGSKISLDGHYNTNPENIEFDFSLKVNDLDINKAYNSFSFVRSLAPAAEHTYGLISIEYDLKGVHNERFELDHNALEGAGVISIAEAQINDMKLFGHIGHISKKEKLKNPVLNSIVMNTSIKDGRLVVRPFSFKMAGFDTELEGLTYFNGNIKFLCKIEFLKDKIKIPFHIEGTYDAPVVKIGKGHEEKVKALVNE